MSIQTKYSDLNSELTLWESSESTITIPGVNLAVTKQDDQITECRLIFQVTPETYQRINTENLFNLKPEIRSPIAGGKFQPLPEIQIEATLDPALLPTLAENATNAEEAATYLQKISQEQPEHPILSTYSWYALEVK
ncbi:MAG: hypothetical protein F6K47_43935 [Symploca sp. SIO2E6]|nr:hypothetical protein [Symploca sp. SIO2E6]